MRKEESWYTDGGAGPFKAEFEARRAERRELLDAWADAKGLCRGGEWSAKMVLDLIQEDEPLLITILNGNISLPNLRERLAEDLKIVEVLERVLKP